MTTPPIEDVAQIQNLTHTYNHIPALRDVTLNIPAQLKVGLLGPDGVGKSTLLSLMSGARQIQKGRVTVLNGNMASSAHRNHVGPRIAYMPQGLGRNLYHDLSIAENLDFFGKLFGQSTKERNQRIAHLTKATGLSPFLGRPAGKLSGGMKQKLGLCCALIHDPDFLILDEPTTGVDPLSRRQFWALIDAIKSERPSMSVLVSTAYMDEAEAFDWIVAMDQGRILASGTPTEIKQDTQSDNLEAAYIQLTSGSRHGKRPALVIPPLQKNQSDQPAIIAEGLTRRFGNFTAVDNVSFEIQKGEIFGFLGSNGCGKTTTMKMLTGLLPPSEGRAQLFGKPVNAQDLETRKRVGFMSQSFSLYGELTVAQNLTLHAKLFQLEPTKAAERIEELVAWFRLEDQLSTLASSLPLGVRQRLSLAVAIIHEPELLILDEPTSGVDPVARDEFWELLISLSRKNGVTIFISTHFMNEALRCDRISLMHAGKVLVSNHPQTLIEEKKAETLEEAFIDYISEAIEGEEQTTHSPLQKNEPFALEEKSLHKKQNAYFSPSRALAYSFRETLEVMRDPVRLTFAFVGSALLVVIMAYGISQDVKDLSYAALDFDQSPESRAYLRNFSGSRYFLERSPLVDKDDMERRLKGNDITLAIEIPPGFGRDLHKNLTPSVSMWIDGANAARAGTIEGYVRGGHALYLADIARSAGYDPTKVGFASIEPRYRYNPSFESIYAMGPSMPPLLLLLFPTILMAVSVAREKEIGTITNFYVTPTKRLEFLIGKQLPYIAIGMINFVSLTLIVLFVLQVPLKGSFLALTLGALLYVAAATGFGLVISTLTKSQVTAVFASAILSMLPTMQFSGMIQPVSTLEGTAYGIGTLWPTTYYMHLSIGAFTKGLGFAELTSDLLALACFAPFFVFVAAAILRKQER